MSADKVESLLEKLCSGDDAAAEQVFLSYEPYLRMVVRRMIPEQLRPKFDSIDVVQSVWADVLTGFREAGWRFKNANQLRAFLVKAARHRFVDRLRQNVVPVDLEDHLEASLFEAIVESDQPRPSEVAQADELWQRILSLCPPAHRELLILKRKGYSIAEIAAQTGMHESSIRRILYDVANKLASQREGE